MLLGRLIINVQVLRKNTIVPIVKGKLVMDGPPDLNRDSRKAACNGIIGDPFARYFRI